MHLLVVEDEPDVAATLQQGLVEEGFEVTLASHAGEALERLDRGHHDLVLLDLGLPGVDGMDVLRTMREKNITIPVIIITARGEVDDRVRGLKVGADDYIVKPFAFAEVLARIEAVTRRAQESDAVLHVAELEIDVLDRRVTNGEQVLELTPLEFDLILYLARHAGRAVSRDMLARDVWKVTSRATPLDNVIEVTVSRLRAKLDGGVRRSMLHTIRGVGYQLGGNV